MAFDTRELREQRHKKIVDSREILDKADKEKRGRSPEERAQYDHLWDESEDLRQKIEDHERANKLERAEDEERLRQQDEDSTRESEKTETRVYAPNEEHLEVRTSKDYHGGFAKRLLGRGGQLTEEENRAQVAGKGEKGGYLYASETFMMELLRDVDDAVITRQHARKFRLPESDSMGVPTVTTKMTDADWTSELGIPTRDQMTFGKRALTPHPLAKEAPVSKVLIAKAPGIMTIIREELARIVGTAEENAFMTGDGSNKPLGAFVASADGIPATRDVSTSATATLIKFDNLKSIKNTLKQQYWPNARWMMHRDRMQQIAKEKDGNGRYLLVDSVVAGDLSQTLLGFPVDLNEYAPNTTGSGNYSCIFGDWNYYWVVDGLDTSVIRLEEIYARQNLDLFIIRAMVDGAPVRAEAFVRGTFA